MTPVKGYTEMKGSGIPWIGEIPCHWDIRRNKTVFSCEKEIVGENSANIQLLSLTTNGIRKKSVDDTSGKVPESYDTYQYVHKDNLVLCLFDLDCSAVFSGLSKYEGMISPAYKVIKCNDNIVPGYADYWFRSVFDGRKFKYLAKNIRYSLTYEDFSALTLPHPPLSEQSAIAAYLDTQCAKIDEIIAQAKASIEDYKQWKASIIYEAVTKGLDPNVEMKDSGIEWIGRMPSDWAIIRVKNLLAEINDRSETGSEEPLSMSQVLGIVPSSMIAVANPATSYVGAKIVRPNDLVFNKLKAHLGVFAVSNYDGLVSPDYAVYRANERANPKFLEYLFKTPNCIQEFKKYITGVGAGLSRLYTSDLFNIKVALPVIDVQKHIVEYLNDFCSQADALIDEKQSLIDDLESYKKSLIYEVVTGKRRVC
jgi:type I restriction enzyme S subunit